MNKNPRAQRHGPNEGLISAVAVGFVFIIIGVVFAATPDLVGAVGTFFNGFTTTNVPSTTINLWVPQNPGTHAVVYNAMMQFCIGIAVLQAVILGVRLIIRSPIRKTAETLGNLVFWSGAAYLIATFLNSMTTVNMWFEFWAAIVITVGASLVARGIVLLARR
jgi:hypothetical protein